LSCTNIHEVRDESRNLLDGKERILLGEKVKSVLLNAR